MAKRITIVVVLVLVVFAALAAFKFMQIKAGMAMGAKFNLAPTVSTVVAKPQTWQPVLTSVGALKAVNGVVVSTDLAGIVSEIAFESGSRVKKGDLLIKLDARQEQAQLVQAQAKLDLTKVSLARQSDLLSKKVAAQADYDAASSQYRQDIAAVENAKALIARKTITAPFDGLLGIRQVNLGQYINVGDKIVPLQSLNPIYVDFSIPQQEIGQVAVGKKIRFKVNGFGDKEFDGEITSIDSLVDPATRNITIEATVQNDDEKLRPGMFVKVDVLLPEVEGVISIPATAINYSPYGNSVFLVKEKKDQNGAVEKNEDGSVKKIVKEVFVKTGSTRGDQVAIVSGLKEGDEIASSGVFKLKGDAEVQVNNKVQPANDANPKPPDT